MNTFIYQFHVCNNYCDLSGALYTPVCSVFSSFKALPLVIDTVIFSYPCVTKCHQLTTIIKQLFQLLALPELSSCGVASIICHPPYPGGRSGRSIQASFQQWKFLEIKVLKNSNRAICLISPQTGARDSHDGCFPNSDRNMRHNSSLPDALPLMARWHHLSSGCVYVYVYLNVTVCVMG